MDIRFLLNGEPVALTNVNATKTLLDWLRVDNQLTGTKEGCTKAIVGLALLSSLTKKSP